MKTHRVRKGNIEEAVVVASQPFQDICQGSAFLLQLWQGGHMVETYPIFKM